MKAKDLETIFDDCLTRVEAGEGLEECLERYPEQVNELAPLLETVFELDLLKEVEPRRPGALEAGHQRLMAEADRLLREEEAGQVERSWLAEIAAYFRAGLAGLPSVAGAGLAALLVILMLGSGAVLASANSIPGDLLYPVKRTSERVRVSLAFDAEEQARLKEMFAEERRQEVQAVVERRREAQVEFSGVVQEVQDGKLAVADLQLVINSDTKVEGAVAGGARLSVEALSKPDGSLIARKVVVLKPAPTPTIVMQTPTQEPIPPDTPTAEGVIEPTFVATLTPTKVPVPLATPTLEWPIELTVTTVVTLPADTRTPTKVPVPMATPTAGRPIKPTVTAMATLPADTPTPTTISLTATPAPTDTPAPTLTLEVVEFSGVVTAIGVHQWVIGGITILIDANTQIDIAVRVGITAHVQAVRRWDGSLLARLIRVESPPTNTPTPIRPASPTPTAARPTATPAATDTPTLTPPPAPSDTPTLTPPPAPTDTPASTPTPEIVEFDGLVTGIAAGRWVIGGVTVFMDANTRIGVAAQVGLTVHVRAVRRSDGSLLALEISVSGP